MLLFQQKSLFFFLDTKNSAFALFFSVKEYLSDVADQGSNYAKLYENLKGLVDKLGPGLLAKLDSPSSALKYVVRF